MELRSRYAMTVCSGTELKVKKHSIMLKQRHERENISVGVENFLCRKGILLAKKQFHDNDTSGGSQSHREDDGASPMWAGFPPATCEDILRRKERVIVYRRKEIIKI